MEIFAVRYIAEEERFLAAQEVDGKLFQLSMPDDTLEWRAAEYHILPTEVDLLMDIVLYEHFLSDDYGTPILFRAATVDQAREEHVARVLSKKQEIRPVARNWKPSAERAKIMRDAGLDQAWIDAVTEDGLEPIRLHHKMDPDVLQEKSFIVRTSVRQHNEGLAQATLARANQQGRREKFRQIRGYLERETPNEQ